jgi:hypothetical protein
MKPGCFLKSIIFLTIIVAVILYIIEHKSELFFNPGKKILTEVFMDNWETELNYVKDTPEKSELKKSLIAYIDSLKYDNIPEDTALDKIVEMVKLASKDSIITGSELEDISEKLKLE